MVDTFGGITEHRGAVWVEGKEAVGWTGCWITLYTTKDKMWRHRGPTLATMDYLPWLMGLKTQEGRTGEKLQVDWGKTLGLVGVRQPQR